jgi:hypothetical protein
MTIGYLTQIPWHALGLLVTFLIGGLIFVNQDMLDDQSSESTDPKKPKEEKCRKKNCL